MQNNSTCIIFCDGEFNGNNFNALHFLQQKSGPTKCICKSAINNPKQLESNKLNTEIVCVVLGGVIQNMDIKKI